ncbi:class I SAM-dependent methyltransferase [Marinobacterium sp. YM272]|uniref:class I SAM-dependent methyltransferase n=1 Tax=Marinobacterium sp. YM272 TaxID=3421654 RepID=UPI003D7F7A26
MSRLIAELESIGALCKDHLVEYYPRVRDRDDVRVLQDSLTEVIVLSSSDHISEFYYESRKEKEFFSVYNSEIKTPKLDDNIRRAKEFSDYIRNKCWLDFGCGLGGMLDELSDEADLAIGLEPNIERARIVSNKGHNIVNSLEELEEKSLDVVTMFHVLEHIEKPLQALSLVLDKLKPGGVLLIEVPHARDALFSLYDCDAFKKFTFWSEHLVLHTRQSLFKTLKVSGFEDIEISGMQRYPLSNHLYWLSMDSPGGHKKWQILSSIELEKEYEASLARLDRTDTLFAVCRKHC